MCLKMTGCTEKKEYFLIILQSSDFIMMHMVIEYWTPVNSESRANDVLSQTVGTMADTAQVVSRYLYYFTTITDQTCLLLEDQCRFFFTFFSSFSLYLTFKSGIAAFGEPMPLE